MRADTDDMTAQLDELSAELDTKQIANIRALDTPGFDTLRELSDLFAESSKKTLPTLQAAIDRGDMKAVQTTAHSLKGSAASLGAREVARVCLAIEQGSKEGLAGGELNVLMRELGTHVDLTVAALKRINQP